MNLAETTSLYQVSAFPPPEEFEIATFESIYLYSSANCLVN